METNKIAFAVCMASMVIGYFFIFSSSYEYYILMLSNFIAILIHENQFCQAIIMSSVSAYILYIMRVIFRSYILPHLLTMSSSVTIHNTDPNFSAVIDFLSKIALAQLSGSQSSIQAVTKEKKMNRKDWIQDWLGTNTRDKAVFDFRPDCDHAIHTFFYNGKKIQLSRSKSEALMGGYSEKPFTPESLTLSIWGSDNSVLKELLSEALLASHEEKTKGTLSIFVQASSSWLNGWELAMTKNARSKDSVILDVDDMEFMLNDARKFLASAQWYLEKGIPYRRGYLLYGPPGCGKTSFAQVLAGELGLDICMLNLTHKGVDDNSLCEYLRDAPRNSIIVLEDVDAIFTERSLSSSSKANKRDSVDCSVSFSGLLNAIDGVASQEGKLFFMTTNHIEKLDAALIRPGRCDLKLEVKLATKMQIERMFLRFYPNETELMHQFVSQIPANELSMASLQGHFLNDSQSAQECVERVSDLLQSIKHQYQTSNKTIYDHLHRLHLERYAPVFEYAGYINTDNLSECKIEDLLPLSLELKYDLQSQNLIKRLLSNDDKIMKEMYAIATVSEIRSSFLSAYPTSYEKIFGEIAPFLRRQQSHNKYSASLTVASLQSASDLDAFPPLLSPGMPSPGMLSLGGRQVSISSNTTDASPEQIDGLCRMFCEALCRNGKGVVSLYNLQKLLEIHPSRPLCAIESASHFVQSDDSMDYRYKAITKYSLYQFLKRAGAGKYLHKFKSKDVLTVEDFLNLETKDSSLKIKFRIPQHVAKFLTQIIEKKIESQQFINFGYHYRPRIIHTFITFYNSQKGLDLNPSDDSTYDGDGDETSELENSNDECKVSTIDTAVEVWDAVSLERYAYEYALLLTDQRGLAKVSLIEILNHLENHKQNPYMAVSSAVRDVLNASPPPAPPKPAPPPVPTEWVYAWLKESTDVDLSHHADAFIAQQLCSKEDLVVGGFVLDDNTLENVLSVSKLGERWRIKDMHQKLLNSTK